MQPEWAGVAVTAIAAAGAGGWAVVTWSRQRATDRDRERERIDSLYVNPLLFAAEDLQSRLYNLLDLGGLAPLRARDPDGRYAAETLYLVARYFAWEQVLLRFTHFGTDAEVLHTTHAIRGAFATDRRGLDPWCLFRSTQSALGQAVTVWRQAEAGFADTISAVDFERLLAKGLGDELRVEQAVVLLREATSVHQLPVRTRERLAEVQAHVVTLLEQLEQKLSAARGLRFSVAGTRTRQKCQLAGAPPPVT